MRKNPIKIGERVFDCFEMRAGIVTNIRVGSNDQLIFTLRADDPWNKTYMDLDTEEDPPVWDSMAENDIYQFVPDRVDYRYNYPICYEHMPMDDGYPYYCPVLDENLFEFETVVLK